MPLDKPPPPIPDFLDTITRVGAAATLSLGAERRLSKPNWISAPSIATSVQRWMSAELRLGSSMGLPSTVMRMRFKPNGFCGVSSRVSLVMSTPS